MFTCADCKEIDCVQAGSDQNACDSFNGEEPMDEKTWGNSVDDALQGQISDLYAAVAILSTSIAELERKFNTIVAAVVKASGPEEER